MNESGNGEALTVNVKLRLSDADYRALQQIARREDRSVSSVLRRAARSYIDNKRKGLI